MDDPVALPPDVVAAVVAHMNADHLDDSLVICRAADPGATSASLLSFDRLRLWFAVDGPTGPRSVEVAWPRPIVERADIRTLLREMTLDARAAARRAPSHRRLGSAGLVLAAVLLVLGAGGPAAAQVTDPTVAPATTTSADGLHTTDGTRTLSVSQAAGLDPAGHAVTVTGTGYDPGKGIYLAICAVPPANQPPSPCGGGVDMGGGSGASAWISSDPPSYAAGLTQPYGPGGSFVVTLRVTPALGGGSDCRQVACAVVSRNDHLRSSDRSQDIFVPINFAAATAPVAPVAPPAPPPEAAPPTTAPAPAAPTTTAPPATTPAPAAPGMAPGDDTSATTERGEGSHEIADDTTGDEPEQVGAAPASATTGGSGRTWGRTVVVLAVALGAVVAAAVTRSRRRAAGTAR